MELTRRERRLLGRRGRRGRIVAAAVAAMALVLGGLGVAGALPGVDGVGEGSPTRVKNADTSDSSDDADAGADAEKDATLSEADATGLENAAGNVKNPVASAVIGALLDPGVAGLSGPGKGDAVSDAARTANGSDPSSADPASGTTKANGRP